MTFEAIIKDLKDKKYAPIYFLQGEEPYFIDQVSDYIAHNVLDESEREFNQTIVYGKDTDALTLLGYAKRYPMMSAYQVVIVKEAQDLKNLDMLLPYVENPLSSTLLVLCYKYKTIDKRLKIGKVLDKKAVLFTSPRLYENKIPEWVEKFVASRKYKIDGCAAAMVGEYLGNDLSKVANELEKLMLNLPQGQEITLKNVEENIGISKEYNVFELQTALAKRDVLKANRIVNYFAANPRNNPLVLTLGNLYNYFSKILLYHTLEDKSNSAVASELKINPFFVNDYTSAARTFPLSKVIDIIGYLREYDVRSKGVDNVSADEGQLLKELVYKILH